MEQEGNKVVADKDSGNSGDWIILSAATVVFFIFFAFFCVQFAGSVWDSCKSADWSCLGEKGGSFRAAMGQFGDSIGGLMNPIIGLITVFLFVRSLRQNQEALKISRDELIETRKAVGQAVKAQEAMEESLRAQLAEAKSQNNFANYFKHLEEFTDHMQEYVLTSEIKIDFRRLHKCIFPECINGHYETDLRVEEIFRSAVDDVFDQFRSLDTNDWEVGVGVCKNIEELVSAFTMQIQQCILIEQLKKDSKGSYASGVKFFVTIRGEKIYFSTDNILRHVSFLLPLLQCFEHALKFKMKNDGFYSTHSDLLSLMGNHFRGALQNGKWGNVTSDGVVAPWASLMKIVR